jgi:hypothetical protein
MDRFSITFRLEYSEQVFNFTHNTLWGEGLINSITNIHQRPINAKNKLSICLVTNLLCLQEHNARNLGRRVAKLTDMKLKFIQIHFKHARSCHSMTRRNRPVYLAYSVYPSSTTTASSTRAAAIYVCSTVLNDYTMYYITTIVTDTLLLTLCLKPLINRSCVPCFWN